MRIEKLPSGSYRIRKTYREKTYSVVVPYKPTQKEALRLMADEMDNAPKLRQHFTVTEAAEDYIRVKEHVLSPSTIKGYRGLIRQISPKFGRMLVSDVAALDVQEEINRFSVGRSAKTVRNMHGFLSAIFRMYAPRLVLTTTLPLYVKKEPYVPTDEDVRRILTASRGTVYEIPLILATFGLRRSEICALTYDDIGDGVVHVNKALVDSGSEWVVKETKTAAGTRDVYVPQAVTDRITRSKVKEGRIYNGKPNSIRNYLARTQKKLGIPHFRLHDLRHYYASTCHYLGIPDSYIMAAGGWASDYVLKGVYRHAMEDKVREQQNLVNEHFSHLIDDKERFKLENSAFQNSAVTRS